MKEWLVSAGLALAALALFWALMFPKAGGPSDRVAMPVSSERGSAGYYALEHWLAAEHIPVVSWRSRYTALVPAGTANEAAAGDVLITTLPRTTLARRAEDEQLDAWVERGNTLVVMAALDDTPRWAELPAAAELGGELLRIARLKISVIEPPKASEADKLRAAVSAALRDAIVTFEPVKTAAGPHPLFTGVGTVSARSDLPASRWQAQATDDTPLLEIARRTDTGDAALWLKPYGKGTVIVSAFASPFSNERLGVAGNARLLGNILAQSLGPHGRVLLDDAHQGLVDYYDARAFFGDARLHHALWWIVLVWFVYVVATPHLRAAPAGRTPVDDAAMLRMTARFYAGAVTAPTAATRLIEHFFNSIRRRRSLREDGTPVWDWLESQARAPRADIDELRTLYERAAAGRSIDLARVQSLLSTLSGHLA